MDEVFPLTETTNKTQNSSTNISVQRALQWSNFILHMHRIQSGDMLSLNHCHPRRRGCSSEHQDKLKFGIKQKYLIRRRRRGIVCRCRMWWPRGVGRRPRSWRGVRRDWAVRGGQGNAPALSYCSGSAEAWSCYPAGTAASHCCPAAAAPSHFFPRRGVGHGDRWWRIDGGMELAPGRSWTKKNSIMRCNREGSGESAPVNFGSRVAELFVRWHIPLRQSKYLLARMIRLMQNTG
jgi:hypothetical protein